MIELPGLIDVHEHFRYPGNPEKETIETGIKAGLKGGFTSVCLMANTNPVIDNPSILKDVLEEYKKYPSCKLYQFSSVTKNLENKELVEIENMHKQGAIGFSNDGKGIQDYGLMKEACERIASVNSIISVHLEDEKYLGENKCEYLQLERDLQIAKDTKVKYHGAHISTKESVELVRQAKKDGIDISVEATPHHLLLTKDFIEQDNGFYKVNPPLRTNEDVESLREALYDGTIDIIATDHAPHTYKEKSKPFVNAAFGFIGSELALPLIYTHFVKTNIIDLNKMIELMSINPSRRFNIQVDNEIEFDETVEFEITKETLQSKSKNTPFLGQSLFGKVTNIK